MAVPKLRFGADDGSEFPEWEEKKLGEITQKVVRKADDKSMADVRMISQGNGFILQSKKYSRENAGESLKKYTLLKKNEFAYNHGASKVKPYGVCYRLIESDEARVPYVYHTFRLKNGNEDYWNYALNTSEMDKQLKKMVSSGVRMDGLLNINYETYMSVKVLIPSLPEQKKIASFLSTIDDIITTTEAELTAWQERKKGVMQKIFNREVRFKADDGSEFPEWEEKRVGDLFKISAGGDIDKKNCSKIFSLKYPYPVYANALVNRGLYGYANYYKVQGDTFTVTGRGDVGYAVARHGKYVPIVRLLVCQPKENDNVDFFAEQVNGVTIFVESTGVSQLTAPQLGNVKVKRPSLPEQRKIADCLSSLDDVINQIQAELSAWKEFKKGLLQQMFV